MNIVKSKHGDSVSITEYFSSMEAAALFAESLLDQYESVKITDFPRFTESGYFTFHCTK